MIETIFLSTAVFFSVNVKDYTTDEHGQFLLPDHKVECQAYEEVRGWEWGDSNCNAEWDKFEIRALEVARKGYAIRVIPPECSDWKKILWSKLVGLCDDGVVRWQEKSK